MATPSEIYYTEFHGKEVMLYNMNKQFIRRFRMSADVVNAQVSGFGRDAVVAIVMKNGKAELYKSNGTLIRR